ncbi:hypothetical protein BN13_160015 [Nostocoides jenkinsii Ben 74]|uniref:Uncharacterized protein n=1 Tax=Nostocoides jenkinsii Ben 74 TaxID=1193518 RepID=A0A077MCA1_9MICO|nr:hypothetical protein BN13_160015 [Tetrasphaera jenkinsii Ben 74]
MEVRYQLRYSPVSGGAAGRNRPEQPAES